MQREETGGIMAASLEEVMLPVDAQERLEDTEGWRAVDPDPERLKEPSLCVWISSCLG